MKVKALLAMAVALGMSAAHAQEMSDEAIKERTKPIGEVNVAGTQTAAATTTGRSPEDIYKNTCAMCHGSGLMGAPRLHNADDWKPRLDEKSLDGVWKNAIAGINAMPPKGSCMDCSDEELKAVIEYMVEGI